jgi:hypothetical protein
MNNNQKITTGGRGGRRPGAGRPKGSGHKISVTDLMLSLDTVLGLPFTERLALNYQHALDRADWKTIQDYDKAILNKIVADQHVIEVDDSATVESRQLAFLKALATVPTVNTIDMGRVETVETVPKVGELGGEVSTHLHTKSVVKKQLDK